MSDKQIGDLASASALDGTELVHVVQGGNSRQTTTGAIKRSAFQGALVKKSTDQTGANYTSSTAIAWDAESYDTDSIHSNVTNNTRLSVPSGWTRVRVSGHVRLANVTADVWVSLAILKNNSILYDGAGQTNSEIGTSSPDIEAFTPVIAVTGGTDYFELVLTVETDTSIDIIAARSWFAIERVS